LDYHYRYDPKDQLSEEWYGDQKTSYAYDPAGNRIQKEKKVNSTATSTTPRTNWYPWRKAGKPDITSMINRAA